VTIETRTYQVPDVSCDHCVAAITSEVQPLEGVESVAVSVEAKTVTVAGGDDQAIRAAIDEAGYDITD
jgi:copper chaperone CopZ